MTIAYHDAPGDGQIPPASIGHNAPPSLIDELRERLAVDYAANITRATALHEGFVRVPETITDDDMAGRITDFIAQIGAATKTLDQARVTAKNPHLTAGRLIDGFFGAPLKQLESDKSDLNGRLGRYLKAKQEDAARRRAEDGAAVVEAVPVAISARGDYGAVGSLRQTWTFEVTSRVTIDLESLRHYLPPDAIDKAIRAFIRAGGRDLSGVRIYQDTRAGVR